MYGPMLTLHELQKIQKNKEEPKFDFEFVYNKKEKDTSSKFPVNEIIQKKKISQIENRISEKLLKNYVIHLKSNGDKKSEEKNLKYAMSHITRIFYNATTPTIKRKNISYSGTTVEETLDKIKHRKGIVSYRYGHSGPSPLAFNFLDAEMMDSETNEKKLLIFIDPYSDEGGPETQEFYDKFELFVPDMGYAPNDDSIRDSVLDDLDSDERDDDWLVDERVDEAYDQEIEGWLEGELADAEKRWEINKDKLEQLKKENKIHTTKVEIIESSLDTDPKED